MNEQDSSQGNFTSSADFLNYPPDLPICEHRGEILSAIRRSQVVVVCGDTGSGKTTQLPKMAMELGLGMNGRRIACTQPRRLAAVTVAERVAGELRTEVGGVVGYQHRFGRRVSDETRVKFMTDGVLLAETRSDPLLRAYDAIIIDEAHERSLNIDFLLGILKRAVSRRKDLKVIVSSATLDVDLFCRFFGDAPRISVPGRLFPIEIRHMPPPEDEERDLARDVAAAVRTLPRDGDVLVFLPGERDIRETADVLHDLRGDVDDVIPLLASLPAGEQQRAFKTSARRRIILATNVAETSVTIPGIRFVIDSGLARISRYVHRTQVQRLQIEPISQASARQRAGRCGRLGPGVCIRLYSEEDFNGREAFTPPEILRSSLAGVILSMFDLRLGDVSQFPFINPPRPAMVHEGLRELLELGAIERDRDGAPVLSQIGRRLARIPVEPRLARMLVAASENAVLPRVLPVVAALSCDDPRRRPSDEKEREKAAQAHARFRVPDSDFLGTLKLWRWWQEETAGLSESKARKLAKATYLSYPRMREWRDLVKQLAQLSTRLGLDADGDTGDDAAFHRALLSGLLSKIGHYDPEARDYRGAHGVRFAIHPGSVLAKKQRRKAQVAPDRRKPQAEKPKDASAEWIVAGELVDTSRLFARNAAAIDVGWIEGVAGAICRHHVHSPEWDAQSGFVRATEQVTLYGLVVVPARRCDFSRFNPAWARDIFIRRGLVDGEFPQPPAPVRENNGLLTALRRMADKARRPELFDAERLAEHFRNAVPEDVCSATALRKWLAGATRRELARFRLEKKDWWSAEGLSGADFPETVRIGDARLSLSYRHSPDNPEEDGITCTVRKSDAAALRLWRSDWLVPGALPEKLLWMLSVLPNSVKRVLQPLEDTVSGLMLHLKPGAETLADAVRRVAYSEWGFRIPQDAWDRVSEPAHFRVRFRIRDDATGRVLATSRDLSEALRAAGVEETRADAVSMAMPSDGGRHVAWDFGTLDETAARGMAGWDVEHHPALHDEGDAVSVRLYSSAATAAAAHELGVTRLCVLAMGREARIPFRSRGMSMTTALYLKTMGYQNEKIADDVLFAAAREAYVASRPPVRDAATFAKRLDELRNEFNSTQNALARLVADSLKTAAELSEKAEDEERYASDTVESVQTQMAWLFFPGFIRFVPFARLMDYPRYLKALSIRLDRARSNPNGDVAKEIRFAPYWNRYVEVATAKKKPRMDAKALAEYRWMLEEYRISIFAPEVKTVCPVSPKRLDEKWLDAEEV